MKYPLAWAEMAKQNSSLKFALLFLSGVAIVFSILCASLALREPLVIERSCFSKAAVFASAERTPEEIEAFIRVALQKRFSFSSEEGSMFWLSPAEEQAKAAEKESFEKKNILQRILVSDIKIEGQRAQVAMDRILSVGKVKSVVPATVSVLFTSFPRNEINPYGLLIEKIDLIKEENSNGR